uniref:ApcA4 n=1 Tax=Acaryochloris sp. HICR111A TaxID=576912 RepID=E3T822_9CYAN|nr:ApcA4 [Acaryochloris sp. HICR111A]
MLTQLARLSIESDGRYASDSELDFIENYCETIETRINTYAKVRDAAEEIIARMELEKKKADPTLFQLAGKDVTERCQSDLHRGLRYAATAVLFSDLDYLRENPLLWYRTIVHSFGFDRDIDATYAIFPTVVKDYLNDEEMTLMSSVFQVYRSVLR